MQISVCRSLQVTRSQYFGTSSKALPIPRATFMRWVRIFAFLPLLLIALAPCVFAQGPQVSPPLGRVIEPIPEELPQRQYSLINVGDSPAAAVLPTAPADLWSSIPSAGLAWGSSPPNQAAHRACTAAAPTAGASPAAFCLRCIRLR